MQRLGDELGVTGMAIYRHFRNKQELVDGILDHFTREAAVTSHAADPADWQAWVRETFSAMNRALAETPGVLPFVASSEAWRFGAAATEVTEETLGVLQAAGFTRRAAAEIYWTALSLAVGGATLALRAAPDESSSTSTAERRRRLKHSFAGESSEKTPNVVRSASELAAVALSPQSFEDGLATYLAAVAHAR